MGTLGHCSHCKEPASNIVYKPKRWEFAQPEGAPFGEIYCQCNQKWTDKSSAKEYKWVPEDRFRLPAVHQSEDQPVAHAAEETQCHSAEGLPSKELTSKEPSDEESSGRPRLRVEGTERVRRRLTGRLYSAMLA